MKISPAPDAPERLLADEGGDAYRAEALSTVVAERCTITIISEHRRQRPKLRTRVPRLVLEVYTLACMVAHRHLSDTDKTSRLDGIRECCLE
jgi:hypothetical protein